MALRTTIDLNAPDKTETTVDVTNTPRGVFSRSRPDPNGPYVYTYTNIGNIKKTVTSTVKTWLANTYAACTTARTSYDGNGSLRISEANPVVKAYTLEISESEETTTITFIPMEE
jgi:hypothetical protein